MRKTVYLDSTIPSFMFDERESMKTFIEITKKWWKGESHEYDIRISEYVLRELKRGSYPRKDEALAFALKLELLPNVPDVFDIAQTYVNKLLMPRDLEGDALHLAFASFYKIDFLLTWNCNHLANANKKNHIRLINVSLNLFTPEIITPMELCREEEP